MTKPRWVLAIIIGLIVIGVATSGGSKSSSSSTATHATTTTTTAPAPRTRWAALRACIDRQPLLSVQVTDSGRHYGVLSQLHGFVAVIDNDGTPAKAAADARARNAPVPPSPAGPGFPADPGSPAETPADFGRYTCRSGAIVYSFNGFKQTAASTLAVERCIAS